MYILYLLTAISLLLSLIKDKNKTKKALLVANKKFMKILPSFIAMLILVSILLYLVPDTLISKYLGNNNKFLGGVIALSFGSLTLMPGFIAYPLCGILLNKGVSYMVLSAFTTSLMMVGIVTFPIERSYFGTKVTLIRNFMSLLIAILIAIITGFCFGEI
jgi:uncharacterized membrane protein YraQ (UPF0718 family)